MPLTPHVVIYPVGRTLILGIDGHPSAFRVTLNHALPNVGPFLACPLFGRSTFQAFDECGKMDGQAGLDRFQAHCKWELSRLRSLSIRMHDATRGLVKCL